MEQTPRMKFDDPTGARAEEEQLEEGEVLRSRRMERLSMQSHSANSSLLAARMMSAREKPSTTQRPEQIGMTTSPISTFRTRPLPRPSSSIFPSTQHSSSRSTSATGREDCKFDLEEESEEGQEEEEGSQCALLASLVRREVIIKIYIRFYNRDLPHPSLDFDLLHSNPKTVWNDSLHHSDGFNQKRVTKINQRKH
ncbi:hypothetical protein Pst134EB_001880 [Puccinia striiformis f. sp. tritici]|nr:hypothetical protein Pst134EB_001880 [Puccinia striiformis f. sp. tritici]